MGGPNNSLPSRVLGSPCHEGIDQDQYGRFDGTGVLEVGDVGYAVLFPSQLCRIMRCARTLTSRLDQPLPVASATPPHPPLGSHGTSSERLQIRRNSTFGRRGSCGFGPLTGPPATLPSLASVWRPPFCSHATPPLSRAPSMCLDPPACCRRLGHAWPAGCGLGRSNRWGEQGKVVQRNSGGFFPPPPGHLQILRLNTCGSFAPNARG